MYIITLEIFKNIFYKVFISIFHSSDICKRWRFAFIALYFSTGLMESPQNYEMKNFEAFILYVVSVDSEPQDIKDRDSFFW